MEVIKITNLTKKFGNFKALNEINLSVNQGEIYGFIGPNGAGKSTTIRIILGLLKASGGDVKVFGLDAFRDVKEIHKRLAYVPAEAKLWDNLTGGEVIDILLKMNNVTDYSLKDKLIKDFELDPSKKCRTYSKGNRQKVLLIAALAADRDLYILDEPTSGLDPLMEKVFQEYILELKQRGKTVFLSSHILSEVEKVCDKIAIIKDGKIVDSGSLNKMRHLTKSKILIKTKDNINLNLEGVSNVEKENNLISFFVEHNQLSTVLSHLGNYTLDHFEANPPTLEDLFLRHYKQEGGKDD